MIAIETFLTAYDPSDLPGTSIDPLGFERGYLFLADKILPGLTNVASRPRYFALLCAGVHLSGSPTDATPRQILRHRQELVLRLERFWALANVLARPEQSGAVRGVTYAKAWAAELERRGETRTDAHYQLLSRQTQYGAIGMYANVADGMRFLNRDDFALTPALGEAAAKAFLKETDMPGTLRRAVVDGSDVSLSTLTDWGERAHVDGEVKTGEAECLLEALRSHPVRYATAILLKLYPWKDADEMELDRLARIAKVLRQTGQNPDLREAIACILAFESCYQLVSLAFERLLWVCRHHAAASVTLLELNADPVLQAVRERLPAQIDRFLNSLNDGTDPAFRHDLDRLSDIRGFLQEASSAVSDIGSFVTAMVSRHADIQHGKFDRGRRKMPWLELNDSRINLTMARAGGANFEATTPQNIVPHPYRLRAADALISASNLAAQP
jgi:hypothetical protein